jgi:hypothetical protein
MATVSRRKWDYLTIPLDDQRTKPLGPLFLHWFDLYRAHRNRCGVTSGKVAASVAMPLSRTKVAIRFVCGSEKQNPIQYLARTVARKSARFIMAIASQGSVKPNHAFRAVGKEPQGPIQIRQASEPNHGSALAQIGANKTAFKYALAINLSARHRSVWPFRFV